jgi:two-component system, NarL family, response regulator
MTASALLVCRCRETPRKMLAQESLRAEHHEHRYPRTLDGVLRSDASGSARRARELATMSTAASTKIRILIADDHPLMRSGIAAVLEAAARFEVVAQAADGREAVELFRKFRPDVALMDVQMPGMDGVEATRVICSETPDARIIVFTTYRGDAQARDALAAGARAYLLKSAIRTELVDALDAVARGERYIAPDVAQELAEHVADRSLSPRELEVLEAIASGLSNKGTADAVGIAEETVKNHVKSILAKLGANDRTHAVSIAFRRGILRPE